MSTKKFGSKDLERRLGPMTVGNFLRSWRESEELTQAEFAKKLKIAPGNLCDIEKGRQILSPKKAADVAKAIGYPPAVLVELAINEELATSGLKMHAKIEVA